jgi:hypothetical protein
VDKLSDVAALVRSKNAGPFWLTFDLMFIDESSFRRAAGSSAINQDRLAATLGVKTSDCHIVISAAARAIKVSVPRHIPSGSWDDTDLVGGQQYAPLLDIDID